MPITIHDVEQGTEAWHELRNGKYTGSSAAKLLKHGAVGYSLTSHNNFRGNFYTKRGHILEDEAIELYEQITGAQVDRPGFVTNSRFPDCGYSPDGLLDEAVVEVKCFMETRHMELYNDNIPVEVLAQVHFGMLICEKPAAHLVIYNPDLAPDVAFRIIPIKANRNIANHFKRILKPQGVAV